MEQLENMTKEEKGVELLATEVRDGPPRLMRLRELFDRLKFHCKITTREGQHGHLFLAEVQAIFSPLRGILSSVDPRGTYESIDSVMTTSTIPAMAAGEEVPARGCGTIRVDGLLFLVCESAADTWRVDNRYWRQHGKGSLWISSSGQQGSLHTGKLAICDVCSSSVHFRAMDKAEWIFLNDSALKGTIRDQEVYPVDLISSEVTVHQVPDTVVCGTFFFEICLLNIVMSMLILDRHAEPELQTHSRDSNESNTAQMEPDEQCCMQNRLQRALPDEVPAGVRGIANQENATIDAIFQQDQVELNTDGSDRDSPQTNRCAECGVPVSPGAKFCGQCGNKVVHMDTVWMSTWMIPWIVCVHAGTVTQTSRNASMEQMSAE